MLAGGRGLEAASPAAHTASIQRRERETPSSSAAWRAVRGVDGLTVSQARSRSRAVSGSGGLSTGWTPR